MAAKGGEALARLALGSRRGGAVKWHLDKYYGDLNLQRRVGACLRLDIGARAVKRVSHLNGGAPKALEALRKAEAGAHFKSAVLYANDIVGSDIAALAAAPETERKEHFDEVAQLMRTLGEGALPCVAILDGCVSGGALGVGAHASACVVTERTRASLPGPSHGYVPEGFVSYQLSRLPHAGLGTYLALTGATLTGQEMVELGLATHATESQAVDRIVHELSHQRARHLGRTLRNIEVASIEPQHEEYSEGHALHYLEDISACFAEPTVSAILERLEAGETLWHAQAAHALKAASPLAIELTHAMIRAAERAECWSEVLPMEARVCASAIGSADCVAGASSLELTKQRRLREAAEMAEAAHDDDVSDESFDEEPNEMDAAAEAQLEQWGEAIRAKDYDTANSLRSELRAGGVCPEALLREAAADPPQSWELASVADVTEEMVSAYLDAAP